MFKKILFVCNESITVVNFRIELIKYLVKNNYTVDVFCADDRRTEEIKESGVNNVFVTPFTNRGINPFALVRLKKKIVRVIKNTNPDIVFTFETKPNIIGVKAAKKCKIRTIASMVEGLGNPFSPTNLKGRFLRLIVSNLYKRSLKHSDLVFFLNQDDKNEFINRKIVTERQSMVIPGIGIDTKTISISNTGNKIKKVMMLSRLTANKGILDFCEIAVLVKKIRPDIVFELYGEEQDIKVRTLQKYIESGSINYCGFTCNPIIALDETTIYVSTSFYREGFPRTLLEAMALGKPIIATDTVGSKDAIKNGVNGYLLHMHDVEGFASKIIELIDDEKEKKRIGESARKYCEEHFDSDKINGMILDCFKVLGN